MSQRPYSTGMVMLQSTAVYAEMMLNTFHPTRWCSRWLGSTTLGDDLRDVAGRGCSTYLHLRLNDGSDA